MKNNIDIILKGSVFKMVCKLSLPNFLGVSSMPIIIFMDAFFISKLGNIELASLALVFPFLICNANDVSWGYRGLQLHQYQDIWVKAISPRPIQLHGMQSLSQ